MDTLLCSGQGTIVQAASPLERNKQPTSKGRVAKPKATKGSHEKSVVLTKQSKNLALTEEMQQETNFVSLLD